MVCPLHQQHARPAAAPCHAVSGTCCQNSALAHKFADAFNDPKSLSIWFYDPEATSRVIEETALAA
jgi:hypothetical protein